MDDKHDEDGGPNETHASEFGVSYSDISISSWEKNHKRRKKANQLTVVHTIDVFSPPQVCPFRSPMSLSK